MGSNTHRRTSVLSTLFVLLLIFFFYDAHPRRCFSQAVPPQNIEVFYPFSSSPPPPVNEPPLTIIPPQVPREGGKSSTRSAVGRAIGITAAGTLVLSGLVFFLILAYSRRRRKEGENQSSVSAVVPHGGGGNNGLASGNFVRFDGNLKGVIVDEDGLDVLYWKNLEEEEGGGDNRSSFKRRSYKNLREEEKRIVGGERRSFKSKPPVTEVPMLRGKSSTSQSPAWAVEGKGFNVDDKQLHNRSTTPPPPPAPGRVFAAAEGKIEGPSAPHPPPPSQQHGAVQKGEIFDPQSTREGLPAPPLPPPPQKFGAASKGKTANPPPPPPPKSGAAKFPAPPPSTGSTSSGEGSEKVKLKPLHWDKVNASADHSMVWDKIDNGSFKFDGDLMEALFGYVATNRKSPRSDNKSTAKPPADDKKPTGPPSQIFILEKRKSQNVGIVVKSLGLTREEIIRALMEGRGLNADAVEKLARISPTDEEKSQILGFHGDPTRLADAESFLYHILKAVPTAFERFEAMLFRSNYDAEVNSVKESLQTLESACKELRTRGLFLKLLEAVLKAGNRLNAGTSRGNALAFNLSALRKLSDFKSTDGKTTLLQFVVQEVVRAEGKRCVLNRNRSFSQSSDSDGQRSDSPLTSDDQEREYMKLGLPVIGGLSAEFSNVKKAATLDYDVLIKTCSALEQQVMEIRGTVSKFGDDSSNGGRFAEEMRGFLDTAEMEIKVLREEEARVMELVKKTTDYYQAGNSKETKLLQLFVIVRDFLGMVDQVCIDISRDVQQKRRSGSSVVVGTSSSAGSPRVFRFPKLPPNFMSDHSKSDSSDNGDDSERSDEIR